MNMEEVSQGQAVTVSLQELVDGTVSFDTLTEAFGPSSLGIIIVKDLDARFQQVRAQVLSNASYLAALPADELESLTSPTAKYLVGWSCGKETLRTGHFDTLKGSYYINCAFYQNPSLQSAPVEKFADLSEYTTDNIWPSADRLPTFRESAEELCTLIIDTAALVARACDRYAKANGIEGYQDGYLERVVSTSLTTKARLLHYFPSNSDDDDNANANANNQDNDDDDDDDDWCATHIDHGCLTGLTSAMFLDEAAVPSSSSSSSSLSPLPELPTSPDPQAGLYIRSRTNQTIKVNIPKDSLAFQTGETLQLITRGKFRAVPHFVKGARSSSNSSGNNENKGQHGMKIARNTLAVFTQPNLGEIVDGENGMSFGDFARGVSERTY